MTERPDWPLEKEENAKEISRSMEACFRVLTRPQTYPNQVVQEAKKSLKYARNSLALALDEIEDPKEQQAIGEIALGLYHYKPTQEN